jgi:ketosteroid isomerase-like protein
VSQEHVEIVRQMLVAFNEEDIERILALTHPDVEIQISPSVSAEPDTYHGHAGMRRYMQSFQDAMEEIRFEAERLYDAGSAVVVTLRLTARGRQTGILVEQRSAGVWKISEDKLIGVRTFPSTGEALDAVGVPQ